MLRAMELTVNETPLLDAAYRRTMERLAQAKAAGHLRRLSKSPGLTYSWIILTASGRHEAMRMDLLLRLEQAMDNLDASMAVRS
jgi:hypothetical protein